MRESRAGTWARLRVFFGAFLIVLSALGGLLVYASFFRDPVSGDTRSDLRIVGAELIALSVTAAVFAAVLKRYLSRDE